MTLRWQLFDSNSVKLGEGDEFPTPDLLPGQTMIMTNEEDVPDPAPVRGPMTHPALRWDEPVEQIASGLLEPPVEARLKILEDRADVHAEQISALMDRADHHWGKPDPATGGVHPSDPLDRAWRHHNMEALELWTRPGMWSVQGDAGEKKRMQVLLTILNGHVQTALKGERVPKPGEQRES